MEILSTSDTPELVTNLEVMQLLSSSKRSSGKKRKQGKLRHCEWIQDKVYHYLRKSPCAKVQSERMPGLLQELKDKFGLTSAECLQVSNFMPQAVVEIHLIIEDLPSRLSREQQEELLKVIGTHMAPEIATSSGGNEETVGELPDGDLAMNGDTEHHVPKARLKSESL